MSKRDSRVADEALRAWFLGPRGENADLLERLTLDALRDHVFWRRNHHPEDGSTIREADKRLPGYDDATARLTEEFHGLLAALKSDVPFFSGRYQGHMLAEQTLASQVGYLAGMLYNPNNVAAEAGPVTTRLELEAADQLAAMIGYPVADCWGHLTSGGTVANFEALWIARGVHYLPVGLALAARELETRVEVRLPDDSIADLRELTLWSLLNLTPSAALDGYDRFHREVPPEEARSALEAHSLSSIGYQDYSRQLGQAFDDPLPAGVVLVSSTAHYSWEKIVRALGIGSSRLVEVPVDANARMDTGALEEICGTLADNRTAVLALVAVCGTTEEGAIDRVDEVVKIRRRIAATRGLTMHLHADACFGGYAAALTRDTNGSRLIGSDIRRLIGEDWPSDDWVSAVSAIGEADSVSIDPHKLGYVPYPAGVFLLRDRRGRNLVSLDPPYLQPDGGNKDETGFLGRWILEGSKPGAAAASVWLSHRVVGLDTEGYGHLLARTMAGARRLRDRLEELGALGDFVVIALPEPDLNVVTWSVTHPDLDGLGEVNLLNEAIYHRLSPAATGEPEYWITRTRLDSPACDGIVAPLLPRLGVTGDDWEREGLVLLRSTVMDPYFDTSPGSTDHCAGLVSAVARAATLALESSQHPD